MGVVIVGTGAIVVVDVSKAEEMTRAAVVLDWSVVSVSVELGAYRIMRTNQRT